MSKAKAANVYLYKIEHRMQICLRYLRIACNTDHVLQYRWENLNLNLHMAERLQNPLTILDPYTGQGLSNQTTFRPI
jgi:hypothetical protein